MNIRKVKWIEFTYFPLILFLPSFFNVFLSIFSNFLEFNIFNYFGLNNIQIVSDVLVSVIIILAFVIINNKHIIHLKLAFMFLANHWKVILVILVSTRVAFMCINKLMTFFNSNFDLSVTENQIRIIEWINKPSSVTIGVITFFSIVFIGPILEEILYRHLIIGEIGKIISYKLMAIVSLVIFALAHVHSIDALNEIVLYLMLGIPIVFVYIKSNFNIYVSIAVHIFSNLASYTYILLT